MWKQHDNYMKQLQQLYNKTSKQTQNRLQEIFDTFNFTTDNIYNIADSKTKKRINTYIEQWKEQGLLKNNNYFTSLANNIYRRIRVKNSEILELLIYSAYIEEQSKLEEPEKQMMYEDANYYYQEGIKK
jgi:DNA-binding protein YbaB